ncbi:MAG: low-complexity protein [Gammaproteobacteria bacterium]|nr:low-complexity protein [Gammaproteobacteria bacterium]
MLNRKMKPIAAAVGAAFATSLAANAIADEAYPFEASLLEDAVILETSHKEGGCGEDKDKDKKGDGDHEGKCGEGKCGEDKDDGDSDDEGEEEESEEE